MTYRPDPYKCITIWQNRDGLIRCRISRAGRKDRTWPRYDNALTAASEQRVIKLVEFNSLVELGSNGIEVSNHWKLRGKALQRYQERQAEKRRTALPASAMERGSIEDMLG